MGQPQARDLHADETFIAAAGAATGGSSEIVREGVTGEAETSGVGLPDLKSSLRSFP